MDWMYLFYFLLALLFFFGARSTGRGWNEEYTSLKQTKMLQGIAALGIALHHMAQKTCAPWHPARYTVHGLDPFVPIGYMLVGLFLFCSGLGLYRSFKSKPDYLKGFFRRRILPVIIAFYLSEFIYTGIRLLMGEKMNLTTILWYLSGLHMANFNAWYLVVIPFFYLAFWAAFRFCKREGMAIAWVFLFTLAYTVLGAFVDHQNDWWMRGEWWYNSIILFPLGLLFGKFEKRVTGFFKKGYWFWLLFFFAGIFLLFQQSEWLINGPWGYYGEWGDRLKVQHRLMSAGSQWVVSLFFTAFCFLLMMKVRLGNKVLAWLGGVTLEFYLMHGVFVELFGYNFLDIAKSIKYIRNVPLYIVMVLVCSVIATIVFHALWKTITGLLTGKRKGALPAGEGNNTQAVAHGPRTLWQDKKTAKIFRIFGHVIWPLLFVILSCVMIFGFQKDDSHIVDNLTITPPKGFSQTSISSRQVVWKYLPQDKKPGMLILDQEIKGDRGQRFANVEEVLVDCDWMTEIELYINPNGIRMVRGFSTEFSGYPERRYYVESSEGVFLLCMIEDSRYYNPEDCEEAMQKVVDSIHRK